MDDYHIYDVITSTKKSVVYKARKKRTLHYVAAKKCEKGDLPKLRHAISALHVMSHVNVLHFEAWYATPKHVWLVLEYCAGGDLGTIISMDGGLPAEAVRLFAADIIAGLLHVHSKGVLLGELRPSGVLLDENGTLKLADFAASQRVDDPMLPERSRTTSTALQYTAPELLLLNPDTVPVECIDKHELELRRHYGSTIAQLQAVFSRSSDLYSVGVVLLELCTGTRPFVGSALEDVMSGVLFSDATSHAVNPKLAALHTSCPALVDLLSGLLRKDPTKRLDWSMVLSHPFWYGNTLGQASAQPLVQLPQADLDSLPAEPLFVRYVQTRVAEVVEQEKIEEAEQSFDLSSIPENTNTVINISASARDDSHSSRAPAFEHPGKVEQVSSLLPKDSELCAEDKDAGKQPEDASPYETSAIHNVSNISYPMAADVSDTDVRDSLLLAADGNNKWVTTESFSDDEATNEADVTQTELACEWKPMQITSPYKHVQSDARDTSDTINISKLDEEDVAVEKPEPSTSAAAIHDNSIFSETTADVSTSNMSRLSQPVTSVVDWSIFLSGMDRTVEPIAGVRIPHIPAIRLGDLPFEPIFIAKEGASAASDRRAVMQSHLSDVYKGIVKGDHALQLNILSYCFQAVTEVPETANWMINSSLVRILLKLIENSSSAGVQARAAVVLGMTIRQATIIVAKVVFDAGLLDAVVRLVVPDHPVGKMVQSTKRYCAAALCELTFFIATQVHRQMLKTDSEDANEWRIPATLTAAIMSMFTPVEDDASVSLRDVLQLIVNVGSLAPMALPLFPTNDFILHILRIISEERNMEQHTTDIKVKALHALHLLVHVGDVSLSVNPQATEAVAILHGQFLAQTAEAHEALSSLLSDRSTKSTERRMGDLFDSLKRQHHALYWAYTASVSVAKISSFHNTAPNERSNGVRTSSYSSLQQQRMMQNAAEIIKLLLIMEEHVAPFTRLASEDLLITLVNAVAKALASSCVLLDSIGSVAAVVRDSSDALQTVLDAVVSVNRCQRIFAMRDEHGKIDAALSYLNGIEAHFTAKISHGVLTWLATRDASTCDNDTFVALLTFIDRLVDDAQHFPGLHAGMLSVKHLSGIATWLAKADSFTVQFHLLKLLQLTLGFLAVESALDIPHDVFLDVLNAIAHTILQLFDNSSSSVDGTLAEESIPIAVLSIQLLHQMLLCSPVVIEASSASKTIAVLKHIAAALAAALTPIPASLPPPTTKASTAAPAIVSPEVVSVSLACLQVLFERPAFHAYFCDSTTPPIPAPPPATTPAPASPSSLSLMAETRALLCAASDACVASPSSSDTVLLLELLCGESFRSFQGWNAGTVQAIHRCFTTAFHSSFQAITMVFEVGIDWMFAVRSTPSSEGFDALNAAVELSLQPVIPAAVVGVLELLLSKRADAMPEMVVLLEFLLEYARIYPAACAQTLCAWGAIPTSATFADSVAKSLTRKAMQSAKVYRTPVDALDAVFSVADNATVDRIAKCLVHVASANAALRKLLSQAPSIVKRAGHVLLR